MVHLRHFEKIEMNLASIALSLFSLLSSLWLYVGYRSEDTWINVFLASLLPTGALHHAREVLHAIIFVPDDLAWRVPGGLWVFATTLMARDLRVMWGRLTLHLALVPVVMALGIEGCQAFHLTDGAYDPWDIFTVVVSAVLAMKLPGFGWPPQELHVRWHWRGSVCLANFAILILADVHR
jgi:hypothetical protein